MSMQSLQKIKVAVLRGGPSSEYDVSLQTGGNILSILRDSEGYEPIDILIARDGAWHRDGLKKAPFKALDHVDVVFNALHGAYGEDGQVQRLLSNLNIPYTGSESIASALAMNKDMAKKVYIEHGLPTPNHEVLSENEFDEEALVYIFRNYLHPVVVKPTNGGSSLGASIAHTFKELEEAVKNAFKFSKKVLVEEYIRGKEATCGVVENTRGEKIYALIPIEIQKPKQSAFFDYDAKYSGKTKELCPGTFSQEETKRIEHMAKRAHEVLGLRHYSRSDFIITPKGKVYILETNSLPGFTEESLLPKSLRATGWQPKDFVDHIVKLSLE